MSFSVDCVSNVPPERPPKSGPRKAAGKKGRFCLIEGQESVEHGRAPACLSLEKFESETTTWDKVCRICNPILFAGGVYGIYALSMGPPGLLSYFSYLSLAGLAARKITAAAIGYEAYQAARDSWLRGTRTLQAEGERQIKKLESKGFIVAKVSLSKSGTTYAACVVAHPQIFQSGNWIIQALGNGEAMEEVIEELAEKNFEYHCNTLVVNGPSVGLSGGWPTRYQMGAGFEAGIQYLEQQVRATHILMRGLSLGGGMMAEAILNHDFTAGIQRGICYLSISDRTFSRLSEIAALFEGRIVKPVFYAVDMELDGVEAAKKLSALDIEHIIIQHSSFYDRKSDGVIPDEVSLAKALDHGRRVLYSDNPLLRKKIFLESSDIDHANPLPRQIEEKLSAHIKNFIENSQLK